MPPFGVFDNAYALQWALPTPEGMTTVRSRSCWKWNGRISWCREPSWR